MHFEINGDASVYPSFARRISDAINTANGSQSSASFRAPPPPEGAIFTQNPAIRLTRLANNGAILETDGLPIAALKFWKTKGNLPASGDTLFRTLIADNDPPFSASF